MVKPDPCFCTGPNSTSSLRSALGNHNVVVYMRGADQVAIEKQRSLIEPACAERGFKIVREFQEFCERPGVKFEAALEALSEADTLVISDLDRVVENPAERALTLRPLLHKFFCQGGKHLIALIEGVDTTTVTGQQACLEYLTQVKDAETQDCWFNR